MEESIPIAKIDIGPAEQAAVQRVLESGWISQGPEVAAFEQVMAEHCGVAEGIATTSCTSALFLVLKALGVGPGDEVIVPAFTWISTATAVEHCGARPIFCDIDLETFNIDLDQVPARVSERTVGIIPVHLFGLPAETTALRSIAERQGLWLLEDAACALGSLRDGRAPGHGTAAACFSFHPRKSITTGEGGMIVTDDAALAQRCRSLRNHGASVSDHQRHQERAPFLLAEYRDFGFNFRMTDLQAALGRVQLSRLEELLGQRRQCAAYYDVELAHVPAIKTPKVPEGCMHAYQSYVCLFGPDIPNIASLPCWESRRNDILRELEERGISTRQGTHAPVRLDCFREKYGIRPDDFPNAWMADGLSIALPLYPGLTERQQRRVVDELRDAIADEHTSWKKAS